MIEARHISKRFGDQDVLKNISLSFHQGKTNLIIGQSGSGKTVMMKCLVGLLPVDEGEISFDGRIISNLSFEEMKHIRQDIGMLFQGGALFDSMTVLENVMFPLNMFSTMNAKEKVERVDFCLNRVNLPKAHKLFPSEISGGMKKRVAIARAIAMQPKYLFCDEPNSGLDPKTANVIDKLIAEITEEYDITTIVNTHDMNSVLEIGDKISFLFEGNLWWEGTREEILHTDNAELNNFVYSTELIRRLKS